MITVSDRALDWCRRWGNIGGSIGSDEQGRLVFTGEMSAPDQQIAAVLVGLVRTTPSLADEIAQVFILILQADRPEGATL